MKKLKPFILLLAAALTLLLTPVSAQAAAKLNYTSVTLCRYHSCKLKVSGTSKTVTWKSSDKNVVKVTKKGKLTAVSAGSARITATVNSKKLTCKVTVKEYQKETVLAAYGYEALKTVVPDASTITINNVYLGSTSDNVPFGMVDCTFKDNTGKKIHAYVYTYEQEQASSSQLTVTTSYYEKNLIVKFDSHEMDSVQQTRCREETVSNLKNANKYLFKYESISVTKGENFDTVNTWVSL